MQMCVQPGVHADYVGLAAEVFSLLSDSTRIRIVLALAPRLTAAGCISLRAVAPRPSLQW